MIKDKQNPAGNRRGFTLAELLTVLVIISILAIVALGVQRASVQSARTARTRTTIAKIDSVITSMYEKYQYRKVDVDQFSDADLENWTGLTIDPANPDDANRGKAKFLIRTQLLREMMLMDMPTCLDEVNYNSLYGQQATPLQVSYRNASVDGMTNAELLYLIVTNGDPESRTMFHEREIGDTNENGLNEFVDGWGNPVCFLRWAPGLNSSSRQPSYDEECRYWNEMTDGESEDFQERYSDPLNPLGLAIDGIVDFPSDWLLVPLVFSYGPDEEPGIDEPKLLGNPFDPEFYLEGGTLAPPGEDTGDEESNDNITNHNFYN